MKYIGFIKEYNKIPEAIDYDELTSSTFLDEEEQKKVANYLSKGELLLGWMGYFKEWKTAELIAPDSYFTDGIWIWPAYFTYYLSKFPKTDLYDEFIQYLALNGFSLKIDTAFYIMQNKLEEELALKLSENN